ncbi:MAG: alpha/beta hydrolase [Planctomycetales bacterium]|nr:alpha/beta hydrolase [Planctomycetales bacterium]
MNRTSIARLASRSLLASLVLLPAICAAQPTPPIPEQRPLQPDIREVAASAPINIPSPTLGGIQFWTDQRVQGGWRIQRNSVTTHCRILDSRNVRHGWGTYEQCEAILLREQAAGKVRPPSAHVVLLIHGLMGSRPLLEPLQKYLQKQGMDAMCVSYASTRHTIDDHAEALAQVIDRLGPGIKRIDFVGHSMGNIVVRRYLAMLPPNSPKLRRLGAMVMLAPPNQGAEIASRIKRSAMFQIIAGDSGQQLADFNNLEGKLAIPSCPFGIVAGGGSGRNPLVEGDDDLLVSVEETKLAGAADFIVVDAMHRSLPKQPEVLEITHRFLTRGYFRSEQERMRLPEARR